MLLLLASLGANRTLITATVVLIRTTAPAAVEFHLPWMVCAGFFSVVQRNELVPAFLAFYLC